MSYVTYELDAMNKVPLVANAAGCDPCKIGWGLPQLWAYCFREEVDIVSDRQLAGLFGVKGLGEHLAAFDFLEPLEDGRWRVRGAARYLRVKEARRAGGKKGRAKQLEDRALKTPDEPGLQRALKTPIEPGVKRDLSPITEVPFQGTEVRHEDPAVFAPPQPGPGGAGQGRTQIRQPDTAPAATSPGPPPSPPVRPVEERPPDCPPDLWEALTHPRPQTELEKRCLSLNPRDYDATNREFRAWAEERNTTHRALRDWVASVQAEQSHGRRKVLIHAGPPADSWPRAQPASAEVTA